tara:strand:- start:169 stop:543 length:375 start_codon:yes stop_codon:yes gene_type:complete
MKIVDQTMSDVFSNKYSAALITLFLVLYGGFAAPTLPKFMVKMFDSPIFRILILSLIVYKGNKDISMSIMIAVAFTISMNIVNKQKFFENFGDHSCNQATMNNPYIDKSYLKNPHLPSKDTFQK